MKKIILSIFLSIFCLCLVGCSTPKQPTHEQKRGEYSTNELYSMYPLYASQHKWNSKFSFNHTFKDGIFSTIESLEDIVCESLSSLFDCDFSDEYLKDNFFALFFSREEKISRESIRDASYKDFFIENGEIYVTISYIDYQEYNGDATSYYDELILIPKEWKDKINKINNFIVNYNFEYNNANIKNEYIMRYSKMNEFKDAYRTQELNKKYDDNDYKKIYMLDVYGEYNDCLVATVTYEGYEHTDEERIVNDTFEDVSITYSFYYPIYALYNSTLYSLTDAYSNGYLTINDLRSISEKCQLKQTN